MMLIMKGLHRCEHVNLSANKAQQIMGIVMTTLSQLYHETSAQK